MMPITKVWGYVFSRPYIPPPEPVVDKVDLIIAARASESRRNEASAEAYRQVHTSLKEGLRK